MRIIFSGGGTGGSVSPLLAIIQELRKRNIKDNFLFLGSKFGPENDLVKSNHINFQVISSGKLRRYLDFKNFLDPFRIIWGFFQSLKIIRGFEPDLVISAGSFVSVPVVWAAWFLGYPSIIHQQDLRSGLANKLMAPFAKTITVAFEDSLKDFSSMKTVLTGNPVRPEILKGSSEKARSLFNLKKNLKTILVLGGGTGALRINEVTASASLKLVERCQIIHLTGLGKGSLKVNHENYHAYDFLTTEMADALKVADIVVSRAGLSTLTELSILGKPSIIIPILGSHQEDNAKIFAENEASIVITEDKLSSELLVEKINSLLNNPELLNKLSERINKICKPDALEKITGIILKFTKQESFMGKARKIHFVGISGIGVSGLAKLMISHKKEITGSDLVSSILAEQLKKMGAKIYIGQSKGENLDNKTDIVIKSNAIPDDNPEIKKAHALKIKVYSYPEALAELAHGKYLIAISGMHGKSTVTSLIGQILKNAHLDPSILVGANVKEFEGNAVLSKGKYFVIEADEYARAFLKYSPNVIVLTRVELDHLDTYTDLDDIVVTFRKYISKLNNKGFIVANADDDNIMEIVKDTPSKVVTYGIKRGVIRAEKIEKTSEGLKFLAGDLEISLRVFGLHNVYNALASIALANQLKIDKKIIKKTLENFQGIGRRFEIIGYFNGCPVISDYAHHPTEIKATLEMAKDTYPNKRIVLLYQPHQHNRTKKLFSEFINAFHQVDLIIMNEIYEVAGRETKKDQNISSRDLVLEIKKKNKEIYYSKDLTESENLVREKSKNNDVIIVMGAGDIYKVAENLIKK